MRERSPRPLERHVDQLAIIGELMLGTAYADGEKVGVEVVAICEQLKRFVEADLLPLEVRRRLERFDPARFDVEAACVRLAPADERERMALIRLLATVSGADHILHPAEERYMARVAAAIGLDPARIEVRLR